MTVLANYDGGSGVLIDTNVWIDCMDDKSQWHSWSVDQLQQLSEQLPLHTNIIVYTELLVPGTNPVALDAMLDVYAVQKTPLPWVCAQLTAAAFQLYRQSGGPRTKPMPDFYLGAHAAIANFSVLTRDVAIFQRYFPRLKLNSPTPS